MKKTLAAPGRHQGKERKMEDEIGSTMSQSVANYGPVARQTEIIQSNNLI
jgi:hypothetical protein